MRVEKRVLNDALRVLGKVVRQTSPVELYRSIRFVGDGDGVMAMATDGVEVVSVIWMRSPKTKSTSACRGSARDLNYTDGKIRFSPATAESTICCPPSEEIAQQYMLALYPPPISASAVGK